MATYNIQDQGADDTGTNPIDPELDPLIENDATIVFPPGEYLLNSLDVPAGVSNVTLQGEPGANLIPKDYGGQNAPAWIHVEGDGFGMHQFSIRVNGKNPGPVDIKADNWELTRLITRGETHCETDGQAPGSSTVARSWFSLWVNSPGATGLMEDCYFADGSNQSVSEGSNRRAVLIDGGKGDITINRCWFEQWGENTIYAKQPAGKVEVLNSFWRNTQNGVRTGGNTLVRNCVSIKDDYHPYNWASSALQRGVGYEAAGEPSGDDYDVWSGTNVVRDSDFYHSFRTPSGVPDSCGAPIGGSAAPERAVIKDCRIYYNSSRSHNAVYNGDSTYGPTRYWELVRVHIDNDSPGSQYGVYVGEQPNSWGPISGVISSENGRYSNHAHIRNNMITGGSPDAPDTTPPLPEPGAGQPMGNATVVTVDNTGETSSSGYTFRGVGSGSPDAGTIHPSGRDDSTVNMVWSEMPARRVKEVDTAINPGKKHVYYIYDGALNLDSWSQTGNATLTVDGETVSPGGSGPESIASTYQGGSWVTIDPGDVSGGASLSAAAMKYRESGEWKTAVEKQ